MGFFRVEDLPEVEMLERRHRAIGIRRVMIRGDRGPQRFVQALPGPELVMLKASWSGPAFATSPASCPIAGPATVRTKIATVRPRTEGLAAVSRLARTELVSSFDMRRGSEGWATGWHLAESVRGSRRNSPPSRDSPRRSGPCRLF